MNRLGLALIVVIGLLAVSIATSPAGGWGIDGRHLLAGGAIAAYAALTHRKDA